MKYLGVILDGGLTWQANSIYIQGKLRKLNYLFYRMTSYFKRKYLISLYKSLYESVLSYGIIHWGTSAHTKPLRTLQNNVCRAIIALEKRTSENILYPKILAPRLQNLYKLKVAMFVFKHKIDFGIHSSVSFTCTGGGPVALYPGWKKDHSLIQLRYKGYEIFGKLPAYCRNALKLSLYKKQVKKSVGL